MKKTTKPLELKLGNLYVMEYNDHFEASRVGSENQTMLVPIILRGIGRLVAITPTQYNLEYNRQVITGPGEYTHSIHGIMKSCVTNIRDLGPGD